MKAENWEVIQVRVIPVVYLPFFVWLVHLIGWADRLQAEEIRWLEQWSLEVVVFCPSLTEKVYFLSYFRESIGEDWK